MEQKPRFGSFIKNNTLFISDDNKEVELFSINDIKITDVNHKISKSEFNDNYIIIKKGKKVFIKLQIV